jgi:hypothetical protein
MKQPDRSNDPMSMPDGASRPGDYDERKLWFEFLKTVNDRHLQSAQRSGITSYVLVATILGLLYKFGPKFPSFYHGAGNLRSCGILFVLLGIGLSSLLFILASVMIASAGDSEFRATHRPILVERRALVVAARSKRASGPRARGHGRRGVAITRRLVFADI